MITTETTPKTQVLITCRTDEMIRKEFAQYQQTDSPVPTKAFHITLGVMPTHLPANGSQLYIGDNVNYEDYLAMLKYLYENPLKENVFKNIQEKAQQAQDTL